MAGQIWATNSLGSYLAAENLSAELRLAVQPLSKFRQFADVHDASHQGMHKGSTFHWDIVNNPATRGTVGTETSTIPETNVTITQGTLTVDEYFNSIPYTGKVEALSEHDVRMFISKFMKFDAARTLDAACHAQFDACLCRLVSSNTTAVTLTTDGTATSTNSLAFQKEHVGLIIDTIKERNVPPYQADDYFAIAWPSALRTLKNDLESVNQYTTEGYRKIARGEIGKYENCRFVEQTNIPKGGAADQATWDAFQGTAEAWDNALSDWIFFFGEDTVAEAVVVPEEIRGKIPTDYGRSQGVAWYYLGGFGIVHSAAAETRIFKWDSAA